MTEKDSSLTMEGEVIPKRKIGRRFTIGEVPAKPRPTKHRKRLSSVMVPYPKQPLLTNIMRKMTMDNLTDKGDDQRSDGSDDKMENLSNQHTLPAAGTGHS